MQFTVNTLINFDGSLYEAGSVVDLSSQEAERFLGTGAITPVDLPFTEKVSALFERKAASIPLVELPAGRI